MKSWKLTALGIAVAAALALGGGASGAQAAELHAGEDHTTLSASQSTTHVFTAGSGFGGVTCTTASFSGTTTDTTETEPTLKPDYTSCKDSFGRTAHVAMNGCQFRLHATSGEGSTYTGDADIVGCESGKSIEITLTPGGLIGECKVTIGEQNGIGPVAFHNVTKGDVKVVLNANNVVNTTSGGFFNCGVSNGSHSEGTYNGDMVVAGTETGKDPANIAVGGAPDPILPRQFHSAESHTILNASQSTTHWFSVDWGFSGISCSIVTFAGTTASATTTEQLIAPHYTKCKDSTSRTVHVDMNECFYRFHATSGSGSTHTGDVDIVGCNASKAIEIAITGGINGDCNVTIGEQNGIGPVEFHNIANGDVRVDSSAHNVVSSTSGGVFNCGVANGTHSEGSYSGDAVVAGTDTGGGAVNIFVE